MFAAKWSGRMAETGRPLMKTVCVALSVLASSSLLDVRSSYAEIYRPWCAVYQGERSGARNCGFTSFQQCMMTAGPGTGASCVQNPWYLAYGSGQGSNGYGKVRKTWVRQY
jgi:hypothetical protein